MTVRAAGLEGESPFAFGGLPALQFDWTVANPDVLQLAHMYAASAAPSLPAGSFSVRTLALRPGTTHVTLCVSACAGHDLRCYGFGFGGGGEGR